MRNADESRKSKHVSRRVLSSSSIVSSAGRASEQRCDQEVVPQKVTHNPRLAPVCIRKCPQVLGDPWVVILCHLDLPTWRSHIAPGVNSSALYIFFAPLHLRRL